MTCASENVRKFNTCSPLEGSDVGAGRTPAGNSERIGRPSYWEPRWWRWVSILLAPMMAVGSIPFVVLLFTSKNYLHHYVSPDLLAVFGGVSGPLFL